jgi:actin-related protein
MLHRSEARVPARGPGRTERQGIDTDVARARRRTSTSTAWSNHMRGPSCAASSAQSESGQQQLLRTSSTRERAPARLQEQLRARAAAEAGAVDAELRSTLADIASLEGQQQEPELESEQQLLTELASDSDSSENMRAVVIDNGSSTIKVGFSGDDAPIATFPAIVGRGRHVYIMVGMDHKSCYVGDEAWSKRGVLLLKHPLDSLGLVTDWNEMENVWHHAFYNEARVSPEESPVLMTEAILNPKANRERMIQICFENFDVPAFYVCTRAALALFASARSTGIVLQVGDGEPYAIPFHQGYAIVHSVLAIRCMKGCQLDDLMGKLLAERGYALCGSSAITTVFSKIKHQLGYVAVDLTAEMRKPERSTTALEKSRQLLEFSKVTHARLGAAGGIADIETDLSRAVAILCRHDISAWFQMSPEDDPIRVGRERFRCAEALFNPKLICGEDYADKLDHDDRMRGTAFHGGVHELVYNSVRSCDAGIRNDLLRNIVCQGGHTRFPGFAERLELEVGKLVAERGVGLEPLRHPGMMLRAADAATAVIHRGKAALRGGRPHVAVVAGEQHSAWCGGSAISSTSSFASKWISKTDYDEEGPTLVHRFCY